MLMMSDDSTGEDGEAVNLKYNNNLTLELQATSIWMKIDVYYS